MVTLGGDLQLTSTYTAPWLNTEFANTAGGFQIQQVFRHQSCTSLAKQGGPADEQRTPCLANCDLGASAPHANDRAVKAPSIPRYGDQSMLCQLELVCTAIMRRQSASRSTSVDAVPSDQAVSATTTHVCGQHAMRLPCQHNRLRLGNEEMKARIKLFSRP